LFSYYTIIFWKEKTREKIVELFIRLANKYHSLEKIQVDYGAGHPLYHSERHMIDQIGGNPGINITEFTDIIGVTKGAVSQVVKKLETEGS